RNQTVAFKFCRRLVRLWQTTEVNQGWKEIDQTNQTFTDTRFATRHRNDQRHASIDIKKRIGLRPLPFLTEVITMVAEEHDDRFVAQLQTIERVKYSSDLC